MSCGRKDVKSKSGFDWFIYCSGHVVWSRKYGVGNME